VDVRGSSEWEALHSTPVSVLHSIRRIQLKYHEVHTRFGYTKDKLFEYLKSAGYWLTHCPEDAHRTGIAILEGDE
jgi:hypothetical protein